MPDYKFQVLITKIIETVRYPEALHDAIEVKKVLH